LTSQSTIAITALDDPRIADYRLLADPAALKRVGLFVAEGRLVVRRLLGRPRFTVRSVLVTPPARAALGDVLGDAVTTYIVEQAVMNRVTGFNMHRGCLAIAERPPAAALAEYPLSTARRVLVLEGINNPDNIGGLFRSAAAFAVDLVVLGPGCADPLYRKSIRTSMAATLQVPFVDAGAWPHALSGLRSSGFSVIALTPAANATPLGEWKGRTDRLAFVTGAEGEGLTPEALAAADDRLRIEIDVGTDSLNVTVAVSIALHWVSETASHK
jgi:tRNA G18 (ribose-2'-O)-methylase SpoU